MPKLEIDYTEEQLKALSYVLMDPLSWVQHAWNNKARKCMDRVVLEVSDKNPKKIKDEEKNQIVKDAAIKTRREKDDNSS